MTTIAYKAGILACDSRETCSGSIVNDNSIKIIDLGEGFYMSGAGDSDDRALRNLLASKELPTVEALREIRQEHESLYLDTSEKRMYLVVCDVKGKNVAISELPITRPVALGSGGAYAWGAMVAGATAVEAVRVAKKIDVNSGGRVRSVKLW